MNKRILSNEEISSIANAAKEMRIENKTNVKVDTDAELETATASIDDDNTIDIIAKEVEDLDIDLFQAQDDNIVEKMTEEKKLSVAKDTLNLNDDEAFEFITLLNEYRKNSKMNVYDRLPKSCKNNIDSLVNEALKSGDIDHKYINKEYIAKMMINEFVNNAEINEAFIDFEKALNEILNVPTVVDMYNEHTKDVMETKISEIVEKIKDEEPEKANILNGVKESFKNARLLSSCISIYLNSPKIRKNVRQADSKIRSHLSSLNRLNETSKFKIYDSFMMIDALNHALIKTPLKATIKDDNINKLISMNINTSDINKFCVLVACSCEGKDPNNIIDAAYVYYIIKNIVMLKHTIEAKTEFTAELINNICDVIAIIRNEEAKFYEENPHLLKSKSSKKSHSTSNGKK